MGPVLTDSINHSQSAATTGMSAGSRHADASLTEERVREGAFVFDVNDKIFVW